MLFDQFDSKLVSCSSQYRNTTPKKVKVLALVVVQIRMQTRAMMQESISGTATMSIRVAVVPAPESYTPGNQCIHTQVDKMYCNSIGVK